MARSTLGALPQGVAAPVFDVARVRPGIVHLGLGGFHRAHMARYIHDLMEVDETALDWGIIGVGLRPTDRPLLDALGAQQGLYTLVERDAKGEQATVIGSICKCVDASETSRVLLDAIDDPAIRIVSLTVTEHGYCLDRATKTLDMESAAILYDRAHPNDPCTAVGVLVEAFSRRHAAGLPAFTTLSCDNIQHNGDVLREAVLTLARLRDTALATWIEHETQFPNTMVDRITPVPSEEQTEALQIRTGLHDRAPLLAEPFRQWVIEDRFTAGRPAWEKVGAQFVDDVAPYEMMKLRLLNTSHLVVAGLGQLAGYRLIDEAISDPLIGRTMRALMVRETEPTLAPVPGIDLAAYKDDLLARFANPAIRDTVERVNADAPINLLLDPIRDRLAANAPIDLLALGLAAWLRRVRGEDDAGQPIPVHHPFADELRKLAIEGGADPEPLLSLRQLFGDLGEDPNLRANVGRWLAALYQIGARATLNQAAHAGLI
nr:mannitol dehydrogenase family protein [Sphingomonas chungangi]